MRSCCFCLVLATTGIVGEGSKETRRIHETPWQFLRILTFGTLPISLSLGTFLMLLSPTSDCTFAGRNYAGCSHRLLLT